MNLREISEAIKEKRALITAIVLVLILIIGGIVYMMISGRRENLTDANRGDIMTVGEGNERGTTGPVNELDSLDDKSSEQKNKGQPDDDPNKEITCYISGEVSMPGIVKVKNGKRLADGIEILGGLTDKADKNRINLALKLKDEQHYIIPAVGERTAGSQAAVGTSQGASQSTGGQGGIDGSKMSGLRATGSDDSNSQDKKININTADASRLKEINGVGEATAKRIIEYREKSGGFKVIEDIKNVTGIGEKKFEAMKDSICV